MPTNSLKTYKAGDYISGSMNVWTIRQGGLRNFKNDWTLAELLLSL
jgi:hypothetical protein